MMNKMRWSLSDGRYISWEEGVLDGDTEIVQLVEMMVQEPADPVVEEGMGDEFPASIDDWQSAYWTIKTAISLFVEGDIEVDAPPYPTIGDVDQPEDAMHESTSTTSKMAKAWIAVMLKGRRRVFASRSEAGRYAAYIRWSRAQGAEPMTVQQWQEMNASVASPPAGGIDAIKSMVADLREDIEFLRSGIPRDWSQQLSTFTKSSELNPENYDKFSDEVEAQGKAGQYLEKEISGDGDLRFLAFVPTRRALATMRKVQAVGEAIEQEVQRRAKEKGLVDRSEEMAVVESKMAKIMGQTKDSADLSDAAYQAEFRPGLKRLLKEYTKLGNEQTEIAKLRQEVLAEIVPTGIKLKEVKGKELSLANAVQPAILRQPLDAVSLDLIASGLKVLPTGWVDSVKIARSGAPAFLPDNNMVIMPTRADFERHSIFGPSLGYQDYASQMRAMVSHEATHFAEQNNPALRVLTYTFHAHRTFGTTSTGEAGTFRKGTVEPLEQRIGGTVEVSEVQNYASEHDQYGDNYAGRRYSYSQNTVRPALNAGGRAMEVLTVGLDNVLFGQYGLGRGGGVDADYRNFVMGALTI